MRWNRQCCLLGEDLRDDWIRTEPKEATVPVKPEQLLGLLESLEEKPELHLAVALVGFLGCGLVNYSRRSKRRSSSVTSSATVLSREAKGAAPGHAAGPKTSWRRASRCTLESGLVQLPTSIRNAKDFKACGHAFGQYLRRHAYWQHMLATTKGLTPYGFRHGFAWRGSLYYDRQIPYRALAKAMGHDPSTHLSYYGKFADQEDVKAAFNAITRPLVAA